MEDKEGEVIQSAPPLQIGEERVRGASDVKKKLLKLGAGWETPKIDDEASFHFVCTFPHGEIFDSSKAINRPLTLPIDVDEKGELALFTFPVDDELDDWPKSSMTQVKIELMSWVSVVDVCNDGGIMKRVEGKGSKDEKPGVLDNVLVKYHVDDGVLDKTPDEGIEFCVKDGHLCPALSLVIVIMRPGEKARLVVLPHYGFREEGRKPIGKFHAIPPNTMLEIDLELVSFKPVIDVSGDIKIFKKVIRDGEGSSVADDGATVTGTNNEEKIETANRNKEEGNILYKNQKYQRAAKKYEKAADCIENGSFEGVEEKQVKALRVSCFLNGAACSLKLNDFQEAFRLCSKLLLLSSFNSNSRCSMYFCTRYIGNDFYCLLSQMLRIEFQNVKVLYRRAQSLIGTGDLISAEMDIKKALEADPENHEVKSLHRTLKQSKAESNQRDAKLYANMFASCKVKTETYGGRRRVVKLLKVSLSHIILKFCMVLFFRREIIQIRKGFFFHWVYERTIKLRKKVLFFRWVYERIQIKKKWFCSSHVSTKGCPIYRR
ncbi:unnamed protein product [Thlaspi arvense]|uniref:peptidylprolyl isomerase n=1 Tax=Thlaspi arvense TaxID=13288 RepID=A0AAU9RUL3_THLAR|nr:unnamed protein product [Thlaspi arvense]